MLVYPRCSSSTGCASPRLDWTGSRERASGLEPSSSIPRLLRERASERAELSDRACPRERQVGACKTRRRVAAPLKKVSLCLITHSAYAKQRVSLDFAPLLPSPLFLLLLRRRRRRLRLVYTDFPAKIDRQTDRRLLLLSERAASSTSSFATSLCSGQRDSPRLSDSFFRPEQ